ncbi:MAG: hypothetical protein LBI87_14535 [Candidatus Accumulibacter sp.]|jgi:hypothetical protein|nr:hypothetical protein [Accumulibacter sp.]
MSIQCLSIGATPCEEECAQVGRPDYEERSRRECLVFQRMLERLHPAPNAEAWLEVKSFAHDFGRHHQVCVCFNEQDEAACHYANRLERKMPAQWDAIAIYELLWQERKERFSCAVVRGEIDEVPAPYRSTDFPALPADKTFPELCRMFPL